MMCTVKMAKHTLFALCGGIAPYTARRGTTQGCAACRNLTQAKQKGLPMWYVVQVRTGTEEDIQKQCEKLISKETLERSFIPYCEQMKRYHGEWHKETKILFPGYIFLVSPDKEKLFFQLKKVMGLTKLIGTGDEVVSLTEEETMKVMEQEQEKYYLPNVIYCYFCEKDGFSVTEEDMEEMVRQMAAERKEDVAELRKQADFELFRSVKLQEHTFHMLMREANTYLEV